MELTAPLGGRAGHGVVDAAASRAFARRRRSSSAVFCGRELTYARSEEDWECPPGALRSESS
jgi:hypothetical protein